MAGPSARAAVTPRPVNVNPGSQGMAAALVLLGPAAMASALLPTPEKPAKTPGKWDREKVPGAWYVPKNPSRIPVQPRYAFEVAPGTDDVGPVQVVPSLAGRLRALRLHWPDEVEEPAFSAQRTTFHDLFTRFPSDVTFHVVTEGQSAARLQALVEAWGVADPTRIHYHPLHLHSTVEQWYEPVTMWARDTALLMRTHDGRPLLLLPRSFRKDGQVDASLNRRIIHGAAAAPALLQERLGLLVRRSELNFEGGDVVPSRQTVLVGGHLVQRNMRDLKLGKAAVVERLQEQLGRPVVVIEPQPAFHLDVGFTWLSEGVVAVADPRLAAAMVRGLKPTGLDLDTMLKADPALADRYDKGAATLLGAGFQVVRMPNLPGLALLTPYLTYNNVLMEDKRVYMPVYDLPVLDEFARSIYRNHGFQVVDMPSARHSTRLWGSVRCASGELQVDEG
jgi:hypothetical protein